VNHEALSSHRGPVLVTVAYLAVYYGLIVNGLRTKTRLRREYRARGERFDRYFGHDRTMLAADRYMLNMLEQMPPFLVLLWLYSVFIGSFGATVAGSIYVATRVAYPILLGRSIESGLPTRILFATFTGYAVLIYLAGGLFLAALR
jgi:hypothetical protein